MNRFESVLVCELNCAVKTIICCKQSIEPSSASESSGRSSSSRTVVPVALVYYLINAKSQPCPLSEWLKILISSNYYYINKLHTHTHTHICNTYTDAYMLHTHKYTHICKAYTDAHMLHTHTHYTYTDVHILHTDRQTHIRCTYTDAHMQHTHKHMLYTLTYTTHILDIHPLHTN